VAERAAAQLPGLGEMLAALDDALQIFKPSRFWEHHNARNLEQLADEGFGAILDRDVQIPPDFFEAVYRVRPTA
jgi:hypothetical protein